MLTFFINHHQLLFDTVSSLNYTTASGKQQAVYISRNLCQAQLPVAIIIRDGQANQVRSPGRVTWSGSPGPAGKPAPSAPGLFDLEPFCRQDIHHPVAEIALYQYLSIFYRSPCTKLVLQYFAKV